MRVLFVLFISFALAFSQDEPVAPPPQCVDNAECGEGLACSEGTCILEACVGKACGENALCLEGECVCDLGYAGDPATACSPDLAPLAAPTRESAEDSNKPCCSANLFPQPIGKKNYYVIDKFEVNWYSAFQYCAAHGMQLATVESEQENEEILEKIAATSLRKKGFYISGTDFASETQWFWFTTGLPISNFSYWTLGRPAYGLANNCLEYLEKNEAAGYRWYDEVCYWNTKRYFICQDYV